MRYASNAKKKQTNISREPDQQPPRPAPETSARERETWAEEKFTVVDKKRSKIPINKWIHGEKITLNENEIVKKNFQKAQTRPKSDKEVKTSVIWER